MRPRPGLLILTVLLPLLTLAQEAKQELNDQMWEAVRRGDTASVKALLDKGADVNAKFRYGTTALFKAAERGNVEVVNLLLARGADATVKDTFYGATAMTWALENGHFEVVGALLKKSPGEVDDALLTGARKGNPKLVRVALDQGGSNKETLTVAVAAATNGESKNQEIAELLKQARAVPPIVLDGPTLNSYTGKYKGDQGGEISITAKDGFLSSRFAGQRSIDLVAIDKTTFRPRDFDGVGLVFNLEDGKVTGFTLKQGGASLLYKRVADPNQP